MSEEGKSFRRLSGARERNSSADVRSLARPQSTRSQVALSTVLDPDVMRVLDDLRRRGHVGDLLADAVAEAVGQERRLDPVLPHNGGPAGNALLTAWTGLVLLVASVAELLTLFNVRGLISWHVAIGALLVPPALMKTASTGWRIARYYFGNPSYGKAGPPPALLRLLGPLVIISTLGLLGSGILLVLLGQVRSRRGVFSVLGFRLDWIGVHQSFFAVWVVATGLHLLGRIVPALRITVASPGGADVPGSWMRWLLLGTMVASAVALAVALVHADGSWMGFPGLDLEHRSD